MPNTSVSIKFVTEVADDGDGQIWVEMDDDRNDGKSEFPYGSKAFFKIFTYPEMTLEILSSDGTVSSEGSGVDDIEDFLTFAQANEASASKPVDSVASTRWFGNSLGAVACAGPSVVASNEGVAVLKLDYTSGFTRRALSLGTKIDPDTGEPYEEYTVVVVVIGTITES